VGRLPVLAPFHELNQDSLVEILTKPKNALVKQYQRFFDMESIRLELTDEALRAVAKLAMKRGTGARGLRAVLEEAMLDVMYDLPSRTDVVACTITKEVILDKSPALLTFRGERKKKEA
jgi:ATP-dependent Clp protease ATP-binding subunit ClpX